MVVGRIDDEQWQRLAADLGLEALSTEERQVLRTQTGANSRQGHVYKPLWERFLQDFTVDEVAAIFNKHGGNAYRHNTYPDVFSHPQTVHLDITRQVDGPSGPVTVMKPPFEFSDTPVEVHRPPPALGQHTAEVLAELGISAG
jgi:crotonobetainyl-CoA:carnitine CoA-transferase CaiB-like acyl-CoA transferase